MTVVAVVTAVIIVKVIDRDTIRNWMEKKHFSKIKVQTIDREKNQITLQVLDAMNSCHNQKNLEDLETFTMQGDEIAKGMRKGMVIKATA